jgi:hypothetical protein
VGYFDIRKDIEICNNGGFFCQACLVGRPSSEQSPDPQYCQSCYGFLLNEASLLPSSQKPAWKPVLNLKDTAYKPFLEGEKPLPIQTPLQNTKEVLVHSKSEQTQAYQNLTQGRPKPSVGGRPRKDIPVDLIHRLSEEGLSISKIVSELRARGQIISAMTVSRTLSGERI